MIGVVGTGLLLVVVVVVLIYTVREDMTVDLDIGRNGEPDSDLR